MTKFARTLVLAAALCWTSTAMAYVPEGTCEGWTTWGAWGSTAYTVSTAELQELQADGTWLTVEVSVDGQHNDPVSGEFDLGVLWDLEADGTYRVQLHSVVYDWLDFVPTAEDLASWDPALVYHFGPTLSSEFVCDAPPPPVYDLDARTPGYWKNHPEAWATTTLELGGVEYDQACLLGVLDLPTRGDLRIKLLHHVIAAKLNLLAGTDPAPVAATIADADAYLAGVVVDCGTLELDGSKPKGAEKDVVDALKTTLDLYNNNLL